MTLISDLPSLGGVTTDDFLIINDGDTETKRCSVGDFASSIDLDSRYSVATHTHAGVYSEIGHNHDSVYAALTGATFTGGLTATTLNLTLPEHADDVAAGTGGLLEGDLYKTSTGEVRIKLA